ncbi:MAG: leucine-rich repeat protein [Eubacteriales bacterium]
MKRLLTFLSGAIVAVVMLCCLVSCDFLFGRKDDAYNDCEHEYELLYSEATCTRGGDKHLRCVKCGYHTTEWEDAIGHDIYTEGEEVAPTCTEYGYSAMEVCRRCGEVVKQSEQIEPLGHTVEIIPGVTATCTENGLTEGKYCTVCGETLEEQQTIYGDHVFEDIVAIEATCTEDGRTAGEVCINCGYARMESQVIPAGHQLVYIEKIEATCTSDGCTEGYKCAVCNYVSSGCEVIPAGHKTVVVEGTAYPKTCTTDGATGDQKCIFCHEIITHSEVIPAGHNVEILPGFPATCSSTGMSEGKVCKDCGKVLENQYTLTSNGHEFDSNGKCKGCSLEITAELTYEVYEPTVAYSFVRKSNSTKYIVTGVAEGFDGRVIVIPDTYNGCPVIAIAANAFEGMTSVKKIVVPKTIISVGENAFNGCSSLEKIECFDFNQSATWDSSCFGDASVQLTAIFNQGKTPYEIYLEAMNSITHNLKNYTWTSTSKAYIAAEYANAMGNPSAAGYLSMEIITKQEQNGDDFYYSQSEIDYMSGETPSTISSYFYFVDGYYYGLDPYNKMFKAAMSKEYWYGSMTANTSSIEISPSSFKDVVFYKGTDGKMYLELAFDPEEFTKLIEGLAGSEMPGIIDNPVYKYVFDENGDLESYGYTSSLKKSINSTSQILIDVFDMEVMSTISSRGTTYISAPSYNYEFYPSQNCPNGHLVVEVPEVKATCFAEGTCAYSYCGRCFAAITERVVTEPSHNYEHGCCTGCGAFEDSKISIGLAYMLNEDSTGYVLMGMGQCTDTEIYVPTYIYGLPVVEIKADAFAGTDVQTIYIGETEYKVSEFNGWTKS